MQDYHIGRPPARPSARPPVRSPPVRPTNFKIRIFGKNRKKLEKIGFLDRSEAAKFETRGSNDRNSKITIEFGMEVGIGSKSRPFKGL